jgi:hypothetical protein
MKYAPSGGRQKGSRNYIGAGKAAEVARTGITPLDYLLKVMRNPREEKFIRLDAAKAAAPYVHPKLAAIDHTVQGQSVIVIKGGLPDEDESGSTDQED